MRKVSVGGEGSKCPLSLEYPLGATAAWWGWGLGYKGRIRNPDLVCTYVQKIGCRIMIYDVEYVSQII